MMPEKSGPPSPGSPARARRRVPTVELTLPDWLVDGDCADEVVCLSTEARMAFVIALARENVRRGTGGPFGAAVFESRTGRLVAPGVNRVMPLECSVAHAELMALMTAQKIVGSYDLGGEGMEALELVSSVEPCAMCLGAIPWSGVRGVVCGATDADARAVGFDEGPKVADWVSALQARGIGVVREVCRAEAGAVLQEYVRHGGHIYGSREATGR